MTLQKPTLSSAIVRAKEPEKPKKEKIYNPAATPGRPGKRGRKISTCTARLRSPGAMRGAEKLKDKLANPHVPLNAAAVAVQKLEPEMTFEEARTFAQRALAWTGQTHNDWLFDRGQK